MRQATKELLCNVLCNNEKTAERMGMILSDSQLDILASGYIIGATIAEDEEETVLKSLGYSRYVDKKITKVWTENGNRVIIEYSYREDEKAQETKTTKQMFDLFDNPGYERLFNLDII